MSFTNINNMNNYIYNRSCIILVNFHKKEEVLIKNIGGLVGIRDFVFLDKSNQSSKVKDILENNILSDCEDGFINKTIIFNNIPNSKIHGFLDGLKKMRINRPLSAIVTEINIEWTLKDLIYNLIEEKNSMAKGKEFKHKN